ncbi:MAG: succinate dehydrogenase / fumarate reductase, rane anchor subunit [Chloroflexota bacterium]|nr:succinate dehydrogenase / fumarate reductase, rane anchor subunit [Chloroflexota bacterium]
MATQAGAVGRSHSKFELYMWFFTRVSGLMMLLLGAYSIIYANLMGGRGLMDAGAQTRWAFFPISFHVSSSEVELAPNFQNPFWQFYSLLLFLFAATHGVNGIRVILKDYVRNPILLAWLNALLLVAWLGVMAAAVYLLFVAQGAA